MTRSSLALLLVTLGCASPGPEPQRPRAAPPAAPPSVRFCGRALDPAETELACTRTDVVDLSPLTALPKLESLVLTFAPVRDLGPLTELSNLKVLVLVFSQVSDLRPLARLPGLEALALSYAPLDDLGPVASLTNLVELDINGTRVTDLTPLAKLPKLEKLDLRDTPVTSVAALVEVRTLKELDLKQTNLDAEALAAFRTARPEVVVRHSSAVSGPPLPPLLPSCRDDPAVSGPTCLWKRFEHARMQRDVTITLDKVDSGCPGPAFVEDLDRLAKAPQASLRAVGWVHAMSAHCRAEIHECDLTGTVSWRGHEFNVHLNHEGIGTVSQGDESAWFMTSDAGGCEG